MIAAASLCFRFCCDIAVTDEIVSGAAVEQYPQSLARLLAKQAAAA